MPGSAGTKRTSTSSLRSKSVLGPDHADQGLGALMRPDRRDQDTGRFEPLRQRLGDLLHRRGDDDAVEIAGPGRDVEAIPQHHLDIVAAELLEPCAGAVGEGPVALDGQHLPAQPRQDRGLIAGAGADLQHAVLLLQLQLLGHVGHHEGLADGLPAGDAERAVAVGVGAVGRLHEGLARNLLHGPQHGLVADPAPPQVELKHHLFRRILSRWAWQSRQAALTGSVMRATADQWIQYELSELRNNFPLESTVPPWNSS